MTPREPIQGYADPLYAQAPEAGEDLLEHSAWLHRLAIGLARDGADPDDLVQATYATALRQPNRGDLPPRRWLAQVLRNVWRMRRRSEVRRTAREHEFVAVTYPDGVPSTESVIERIEGKRMLLELVEELDEPYRSTVRMRFQEGLSSAEIARRDGVPAGTVRWRLMTGLDRLRRSLDVRSGGDRGRWVVALLPPVMVAPKIAAKLGFGIGAAAAIAAGVAAIGFALRAPPQPAWSPLGEGVGGVELPYRHIVPMPPPPAPAEVDDPADAEAGSPKQRVAPPKAPADPPPPAPSAPKRDPGVVGGAVEGIVGGVIPAPKQQ